MDKVMRRIAKLVSAAAVTAVAAAAIRRLLGREEQAAPESPRTRTPHRPPATHSNGGRPDSEGGPTRDELYGEARRLDIEGRSKMNKQELKQAVEAAKTGGTT